MLQYDNIQERGSLLPQVGPRGKDEADLPDLENRPSYYNLPWPKERELSLRLSIGAPCGSNISIYIFRGGSIAQIRVRVATDWLGHCLLTEFCNAVAKLGLRTGHFYNFSKCSSPRQEYCNICVRELSNRPYSRSGNFPPEASAVCDGTEKLNDS